MQVLTTRLLEALRKCGFGGEEGLWPCLRSQPAALASIVRMLETPETLVNAAYVLGDLAWRARKRFHDQKLLMDAGISNGLMRTVFDASVDCSSNAILALPFLACGVEDARKELAKAEEGVLAAVVYEVSARLNRIQALAGEERVEAEFRLHVLTSPFKLQTRASR